MNKKIAIELAFGIIIIIILAVGGALYFINRNIGNVPVPVTKQSTPVPYCDDLDISDEQIKVAAEESLVGLKNPWGNVEESQIWADRVEKKLGCKIEKEPVEIDSQQRIESGNEAWQLYQNEEYNFKIKYPESFAKQEGKLLYI